MCIRDRACESQAGNAGRAWARGRLLEVQSCPGACSACRQMSRQLPVSYTHLTLPTICSV
eukprot:5442341-Alexandrium_andersonii.AAC.1